MTVTESLRGKTCEWHLQIYSAVVDEEMSSPGEMDSFSRLWHLKSERITVCHGCLVVLSDETFEFVPDGRQSPLLWEIFQHLDVACDEYGTLKTHVSCSTNLSNIFFQL